MVNATFDHYVNKDFLCPALHFCEPVYEKFDVEGLIEDILKDKPKKEQLVPKEDKTF